MPGSAATAQDVVSRSWTVSGWDSVMKRSIRVAPGTTGVAPVRAGSLHVTLSVPSCTSDVAVISASAVCGSSASPVR
jgi:hypothetical protein